MGLYGMLSKVAKKAGQAFRWAIRPLKDIWVRGIDHSHTPVVVYQMGKVGSSSLRHSLKYRGLWPVWHTHRMNPEYIEEIKEERVRRGVSPVLTSVDSRGLDLYNSLVKKGRPTKFISLVREPVSRNVQLSFSTTWQKKTLGTIFHSNRF